MKVSVVTAVYNNVAEVEDAIRSVLSQRGVDVEPIVVDGGSNDGTLEVLERYRDRFGAFVSGRDGGIYPALNRGLRLATGDYVGFLHSDDVFASPDSLQRLFTTIGESRPEAVWGDLDYVRKSDVKSVVRRWRSSPVSRRLLRWGWMPPHPALYVRRDVFLALGGFDESMRVSADYDFILRLFHRGGEGRYVPGTVVSMRMGGNSNRDLKAMIRKSREDLTAMKRAGIPRLFAILGKNVGKLPQFLARG